MFIFIRKNGYYASQKRLCKQPVLRGGIFIAFSKRQFEVKKSPKIQLYQYVREWLDTGKKFSGLIKKSACLLLPLNIVRKLFSDQAARLQPVKKRRGLRMNSYCCGVSEDIADMLIIRSVAALLFF